MFRFQQVYGQEFPRISPAQQVLAPGSPESWQDRLRRRRASPPHTPENLARTGARQRSSSEDPVSARTPGAPTKPDAYGILDEDQEAYGPGRWIHEVPPPLFPAPVKYRARDVLIRPPVLCPWWEPKTTPQHNEAAMRAQLHQKKVKVVSWKEIHPHELQMGFLDALFRRDAYHHHVRKGMSDAEKEEAYGRFAREHPGDAFPELLGFPSCSRPLATEADAAWVFLHRL